MITNALEIGVAPAGEILGEARAALGEVVPALARLVRGIPDPQAAAVGTWTTGEVAAHLTHVLAGDADAIAGRPLPAVSVTRPEIAVLTAQFLADDAERDPAVLADRIEELGDEFDNIASRTRAATVEWLGGAVLPPSAVACHLLEECLVHGHDVAAATGQRWHIHSRHALLAIEGGALPIIAALPPAAFVNQQKAGSFRARVEARLRGGGRTQLVIEDGTQRFVPSTGGGVDARGSVSMSIVSEWSGTTP